MFFGRGLLLCFAIERDKLVQALCLRDALFNILKFSQYRAARLDPRLAMAYWGQALVLGPNINAPMDPANEPKAVEVIKKAIALKAKASPRERAACTADHSRCSQGRAKEDVVQLNAIFPTRDIGADPARVNDRGQTALMWAAARNNAAPDARNRNCSPSSTF